MSEQSEKKRESIRKAIKKLAAICRVPVNQEALEHFERAAMQFEEDIVLKAMVHFMDDATFPSVNDLRKRLGFLSDKCAPPRPRDDNSHLKVVDWAVGERGFIKAECPDDISPSEIEPFFDGKLSLLTEQGYRTGQRIRYDSDVERTENENGRERVLKRRQIKEHIWAIREFIPVVENNA